MINVVFFARLREQLGRAQQQLAWPQEGSAQALAEQLVAANGENWQVLLAEDTVYAINQRVVDRDALVRDGDEVAFFPPVTGG